MMKWDCAFSACLMNIVPDDNPYVTDGRYIVLCRTCASSVVSPDAMVYIIDHCSYQTKSPHG